MFIYNGGQEPENNLKAAIVVPFQLDYATPSGTYTIPVPAGYKVDQVNCVTTQAFNGTTPSLKIGDGDDDDGYLDNTDLAITVARTVTVPAEKLSRNSANPYANGKTYDVDDTIDFTWVKAADGTAGVLKGEVIMVNRKKGGVPAGTTTVTPL